ncbi:MAG: hypothetical protein ACYTX0_41335, partial [Nostoc sp.]
MSNPKPSPFKKLFETKDEPQLEPELPTEATTESNVTHTPTPLAPAATPYEPRKRRRPATVNRSDEDL